MGHHLVANQTDVKLGKRARLDKFVDYSGDFSCLTVGYLHPVVGIRTPYLFVL